MGGVARGAGAGEERVAEQRRPAIGGHRETVDAPGLGGVVRVGLVGEEVGLRATRADDGGWSA